MQHAESDTSCLNDERCITYIVLSEDALSFPKGHHLSSRPDSREEGFLDQKEGVAWSWASTLHLLQAYIRVQKPK